MAILHLLQVTSLASRTADRGCFIDSYQSTHHVSICRVTYKIMHFAKSYHNLFIVDFVNNAFNPTTLAAFVVSIALVEAYDITW